MSDKLINPGKREGTVLAPSSKSMAHRHLICAALSGRKTVIRCEGVSKDIKATALCLSAMGADIKMTADPDNERITLIEVDPVGICNYQEQKCPDDPGSNTGAELTDITKMTGILLCEESGSTLRFLLPLAGALGLNASFEMKGRLPDRPMDEYETILKQHGMNISRKGNMLNCSGRLCSGDYELAGNISSQYFSGLLFSLPLLNGESRIITKGALESADYFEMTKDVVRKAGITWSEIDNVMTIPGGQHYDSPGDISVEGDYSSAAFFLCAGALSDFGICVTGLEPDSIQGDRSICQILKQFGAMVYVLPGKKAVFVGYHKDIGFF